MLAFLRDMMGQWLRQTREMNYLLFNELILLIDQTTFSMTDHIRTVYLHTAIYSSFCNYGIYPYPVIG